MNAALRIQIVVEQRKAQAALKDLERQLKTMGGIVGATSGAAARGSGVRTGGALGATAAAASSRLRMTQRQLNILNKSIEATFGSGAIVRWGRATSSSLSVTQSRIKSVNAGLNKFGTGVAQTMRITQASLGGINKSLTATFGPGQSSKIGMTQASLQRINRGMGQAFGKVPQSQMLAINRNLTKMANQAGVTATKLAMTQRQIAAINRSINQTFGGGGGQRGVRTQWGQGALATANQIAAINRNLARMGAAGGAAGGGGARDMLGKLRALSVAADGVGNKILGWGKNMQWTGRILSMRITAPLALAAGLGVSWALDFERSMTRLQKVYGDLHMEQGQVLSDTKLLGEGFIALSNIYGIAAEEVANLGAMWAAAGVQGAALGELTELSIQTSILGDLDPANTVQSLITIMSAYQLSVEEVRSAIDTLNIVENQSAAQMGDLIEVIAKAGGVASQSGVSIRELAAAAAILVPASGSAEEAGNSLRSIMFRIMAPTNQAAEALNSLGLGIDTVGWNSLTLTQRLDRIAVEYGKLSQAQKIVFARNVGQLWQGSRLISILEDLNSENSVYRRLLDETSDAQLNSTRTAQELQTVLASGPRRFEILTNRARNFLMQAMIPLIPVINKMLTEVIRLTTWFSNLSPEIQQLVFYFLGLLAVSGPIMSFLGILGILLAGPIKGFGLLGKVVAYTAGFMVGFFGVMGKGIITVLAWITRGTIIWAAEQVGIHAATTTTISSLWASLPFMMKAALVVGFAALLALLMTVLWRFRHTIAEFLLDIARMIGQFFQSMARGIANFFRGLFGGGGGPEATVTVRRGNYFANGTEDHRAQIARAGAMRVWAEPETGGEAYIPLAPSKRRRSTEILDDVADRFGYGLLAMADGGVIGGLKAARDRAVAAHGNPQVKEDVRLAGIAGVDPGVIRAAHAELQALNVQMRQLEDAIDAQDVVVEQWASRLREADRAIDVLNDRMGELQDEASVLQDQLARSESQLSDWLNTPIAGTYAMEDALWANQQAQNQWRLQVARAEQAIRAAGYSVEDVRDAYDRYADTTGEADDATRALARSLGLNSLEADEVRNRMALLSGELEGLRSQQLDLRLAGAGSDVLAGLDAQIADIEGQRRALGDLLGNRDTVIPPEMLEFGKVLSDAAKAMQDLGTEAEIIDLEGNLGLDPIRKQIEDLQRIPEQSGASIIAGIIGTKAEIDQIKAALDPIEASIREQERLVREAETARKAIQESHDIEAEKLRVIEEEYAGIRDRAQEIESLISEITNLGSQLEQDLKDSASAADDFASKFADLADGDFDLAIGTGLVPMEPGDIQKWVDDLQAELEAAFNTSPKDLGARLRGNVFQQMFANLEGQFKEQFDLFKEKVRTWLTEDLWDWMNEPRFDLRDVDRWVGRQFVKLWDAFEVEAGAADIASGFTGLFDDDFFGWEPDFSGWWSGLWDDQLFGWDVPGLSSGWRELWDNDIFGWTPDIGGWWDGLWDDELFGWEIPMPDIGSWFGGGEGGGLAAQFTNMDLAESIAPHFSSLGTTLRDNVINPFLELPDRILGVFTGAWTTLSEFATTTLFPFFGGLWGWFDTNVLGQLGFGSLASRFLGFFTGAWGTLNTYWTTTLQPFFGNIWGWFNTNVLGHLGFGSLGSRFLGFFTGLWGTLSTYWTTTLQPFFGNLWGWFNTNVLGQLGFGSLAGRFLGFFSGIWSAISNYWATTLQPFFSGMWTWFNTNVLGALGFGGVGARFGAIFGGVQTAIGGALAGFREAVRTPLNLGIGVIRTLASRINSVLNFLRLPANVPLPALIEAGGGGGGGGDMNYRATGGLVPLARGGWVPPVETKWGFVTNEARAIVGEGSRFYPEYVIPTDPRYRSRAAGLLEQASAKIGRAPHSALALASGGTIPTFGIGGWIDAGVDRVVGGVKAAGNAFRKGAVKLFWDPLHGQIQGAINALPGDMGGMVRGMPQHALNAADGWVRGVEAGVPKLAEILLGEGAFARFPGGWPAPRAGVLSSNTRAAMNFIRATWGIRDIGGVGHRSNKSDHPLGKALDAMIPNWNKDSGKKVGNEIAGWFGANSAMFGTKYIIWNDLINKGAGWKRYTHPSGNTTNPTLRHLDHVHVSFYGKGGIPPYAVGMANGGIVRGGRGGVLAHIGEGRRDEAVIPLGSGGLGRTINIYGDLEFPNITGPDDVENFLANLEALAEV